jgi:hypothetical protein
MEGRMKISKGKRGKRFEERVGEAALEEAEGGKRVRVNGAMTAGMVNGNSRRYAAPVLEAALGELSQHLNESAGQGRAVELLGEAEHPSDKSTRRPNLLETVARREYARIRR